MGRNLLVGLLAFSTACSDKDGVNEDTVETAEPITADDALFVFVDMIGQAMEGVDVRYGDSVDTTDIRGEATIELPLNSLVHVETSSESSLPGLLYGAMGPEATDFGTWRGPTQAQFEGILTMLGLAVDPARGVIAANILDHTRTGIEGASLELSDALYEVGLTMVGMGMEVTEASSISGMMVYLNVEPGEYALLPVMPNGESCTLFPAGVTDMGSIRVEAGKMTVLVMNCD